MFLFYLKLQLQIPVAGETKTKKGCNTRYGETIEKMATAS
jgi:hypothetical protein